MAVYVDDMNAKYGRMIMCHMIADTDEELREMARKIGVQQKWHQGDHFDICLSKKAKAIELGAIPITYRQLGGLSLRRKRTGSLGTPEDFDRWLAEEKNKRKTDE